MCIRDSIKLSPFKIVYGQNLPLYLVRLHTITRFSWEGNKRAEEMKYLHTKVRAKIEISNEVANNQAHKYKNDAHFQLGDLVWLDLKKETFPSKTKS